MRISKFLWFLSNNIKAIIPVFSPSYISRYRRGSITYTSDNASHDTNRWNKLNKRMLIHMHLVYYICIFMRNVDINFMYGLRLAIDMHCLDICLVNTPRNLIEI